MSLEVALEHHHRGLALLPLARRDKKPNFKVLTEVHGSREWGPLGARRATPAEIMSWHEADPDTNLGVILGEPSGGLVVLDIDRKPAHSVAHPSTPIVRTSRGRHIYLHAEERVQTRCFPWGELRGDGSYVVLPDSVHPTGARYEYLISLDDAELAPLRHLKVDGSSPLNHPEQRTSGVHPQEYELPRYPYAGSAGELGVALEELAKHEDSVLRASKALGIDCPLGEPFCCVLPGQTDRHPSASIYRDPKHGIYMYRDWHCCAGKEWLPLSWVRAARGYRHLKPLGQAESARWYLRLFYEAGILRPSPVELPPLPDMTPSATRAVADGFALLLGLRHLTEDPGAPAPYTRRFAGAWCGIGERAAGEAIGELLALGIISVDGEHTARWRTMRLFAPGSGGRRRRRS